MKSRAIYSGVFFALAYLLCACPNSVKHSVAEPAVDTVRRVTLIFGGDVMQHSQQVRAARQSDGSYSYNSVFQYVKPLFDSADIAVVNLETTLADSPPYSGYPLFRSPSALAVGLAAAGADVALLANNHICDRGADGIKNTVRALDSAGVKHIGAWCDTLRIDNTLKLTANGFDIRLLNYTYGTNGMPIPRGMRVNMIDTILIANDLASIVRTDSTVIIACLHWGEEYRTKQNTTQTALAKWLHSRGVDIIVGSHPHVVQPIDYQTNTIYSLGNLVSAQRFPNTDRGMLVRITITQTSIAGRTIDIEPIQTQVRLPDYVIELK